MVYALKRFIGPCFDVYFFLWSNGVPHWEREKLLWEQEQRKEWNYVQSRKRRNTANPKSQHGHHIRFAPNLVCDSPKVKHQPAPIHLTLRVGSFVLDTCVPLTRVFGRLNRDLNPSLGSSDPTFAACSSNGPSKVGTLASNSIFQNSLGQTLCVKCLSSGHRAHFCRATWRCKACFKLGHKACWCLTQAKPRIVWPPQKDILFTRSTCVNTS
jgi:hypothetical protein